MAVRLYPHNQSPEISTPKEQRLASVPPGTIRERHPQRNDPGLEGYEAAKQYYAEIFADPDLDALENLLVYGWGRLTSLAQRRVNVLGCPNCGRLQEITKVQHLLALQTVDLHGVASHELDGVYWG